MWLQSSKENDTSLDEEPMLSKEHERQSILLNRVQDIHRIGSIQGHLGWDQETLMPEKGAKSRGEIMAWLAALAHEKVTDSEMGDCLDDLKSETTLMRASKPTYENSGSVTIRQPNSQQSLFQNLHKLEVRRWLRGKKRERMLILPPFCHICRPLSI